MSIWKRASKSGFSLFAQSHAVKAAAWAAILPLLTSGSIKPVVERAYKLDEAAEALRHHPRVDSIDSATEAST